MFWRLAGVPSRAGGRGAWAYLLAASALACGGEDADAEGVYADADAGCGVLVCPVGVSNCCTEVVATASDNELGGYERRPDLLRTFVQSSSEVRADFVFNVVDQAGTITFNLARQRRLTSLNVLLTTSGPSGSVVATLSDVTGAGCVGDLAPAAAAAPMSYEVDLQGDEFCFVGGTPGSGSALDFQVRADGPGPVSLAIQRVELN
jgi:hypothetical protein